MELKDYSFWGAFKSREDLKPFDVSGLLLFALQLRFGIEDIALTATNSLTGGFGDKKADLVYIDSEQGYAVIAQSYITDNLVGKDGKPKLEAPANKASDLNTAVPWLLCRDIGDLPESLQPHAQELRQTIKDGLIRQLHIWYVHNLPESKNVREELTTVEHTTDSIIKTYFKQQETIDIQALEIGVNTLEEWYKSISTPILVPLEFDIPVSGGFPIKEEDWQSYITTVPAKWLYEQFQFHRNKLFSANVRDYLGSRNVDKNINNGIKQTAQVDPGHFWVFNNGITALVHEFEERTPGDGKYLHFKGISIVNGAQTVGAIGNLDAPPDDKAKVLVRFITCNNPDTLYDIVRYNNSQNKITSADFRSNDIVQRKLSDQFKQIPAVKYVPRRGGYEDIIKRSSDALPSVTAGQALAAFHADPDIAYHQKTHMWEDDKLYSTYFNEQTTAKHIVFAYSLLKAVENKKTYLWNKSKENSLLTIEKGQLEFFRKRGSTFLMTSAIAKCLEIILNRQIPKEFNLAFKANLAPNQAAAKWSPIVDIASAFSAPLIEGLADGIRKRETVDKAIPIFESLVASTREANKQIYSAFAQQVV